MTEGIMTQKATPFLKCFVLFLFILTAKVLTSRPNEAHETRNDIHHAKPSYYVRTFTKYHHRRTIQWNNQEKDHDWPVTQEHTKVIGKRSLNVEQKWDDELLYSNSVNKNAFPWFPRVKRSVDLDSKEINQNSNEIKQMTSDSVRENLANFDKSVINGKDEFGNKNGLSKDVKKYKVKAAIVVTDPPTTVGPTISCLYKIHSVAKSVTPSYTDDKNAQLMVESENFDTGPILDMMLPSGPAQIEQCRDRRASCYTLWHQDREGNITILGQGCWKSSGSHKNGDSLCDKCTLVTARLPETKFCCCTKSFCNADFLSLKEETVTIKAQSTMEVTPSPNPYSNVVASGILALAAIAVMIVLLHRFYNRKQPDTPVDEQDNMNKGDIMGNGPDALATGLLCVDNLTLMEHIGQGKFGSVWRGSLGSTPVAVKLFSNPNAWQKEAAIYGLPHLSHPNILRYYGSDTRETLTDGSREYLIVLELCTSTLRTRLIEAPLTWIEFATLAHGLASALAHLHTPSGNKPCVVHRDVNSLNVLVTGNTCRLADFGLAHTLHHAHPPSRLTEVCVQAGTLRYLSPEALEGALDLSVCGAALQAVDVFALALVLWEMLWRTAPAHPLGRAPPYALPYHHHLDHHPTLHQMQTLVSRNKVRPPLPKGPVPELRALKIATDTCDECWDHDAEARLTAVCVEERMNELKQLVCVQPPHIHDNKLHPPGDTLPTPETDKNSNCTTSQTYDVTTPLLYPHPHIGRNACIERNTDTTQHNTVQLIHKSLKDITVPENRQIEENCLSVARTPRVPIIENSHEIRSYQRPLAYVPNDVTSTDSDRIKETNLLQEVKIEKPKWGIRKFFEKFNKKVETEVKLLPESSQRTKTSIVNDKPLNTGLDRPANLVLSPNNYFEAPCLSPPNKTLSPTMMEERVFKEMPSRDADTPNQIFAVIVPKANPIDIKTKKGSSESINKSVRTSMSSQSMFKSNSESEDSTVKKRLSCDNKIISNSASSSRASINLELQYIDNTENFNQASPFEVNSDCSSSEDEHLMLLSENGGSKITMQTITKEKDVLKETCQTKTDFTFNKYQNKYTNFDNEYSDPNDKENLLYSGDNPVYLAAINGEIGVSGKVFQEETPKPCLKTLTIKRQHSLEQVSELFSSAGDVNLLNPAGRVKTPGDLPIAVRRARRDRALLKGRANECNRLSLYDDRMMFGNSL